MAPSKTFLDCDEWLLPACEDFTPDFPMFFDNDYSALFNTGNPEQSDEPETLLDQDIPPFTEVQDSFSHHGDFSLIEICHLAEALRQFAGAIEKESPLSSHSTMLLQSVRTFITQTRSLGEKLKSMQESFQELRSMLQTVKDNFENHPRWTARDNSVRCSSLRSEDLPGILAEMKRKVYALEKQVDQLNLSAI